MEGLFDDITITAARCCGGCRNGSNRFADNGMLGCRRRWQLRRRKSINVLMVGNSQMTDIQKG